MPGAGSSPELASYGDLVLNFETYQAGIEGKPLDLTYMEYELLKFFVTHPGKVFTREQLLSRVWGYEYYGGARTVDVHVRRLRAKLGEEHAFLIQTVRSVGYRFGQVRWPGAQAPKPAERPERRRLTARRSRVLARQPAGDQRPDRAARASPRSGPITKIASRISTTPTTATRPPIDMRADGRHRPR